MKSIRKASLLKVLVLFVGALGASALPASAQSTTGTFTLAHKVRWGTAVLPAGDYTFSVDTQTWPARVMVRELGGTTSAMILPQAYSDQKLAGGSTLVIEQKAGESVVSSLKLANSRTGAGILFGESHYSGGNGRSEPNRRFSTRQVTNQCGSGHRT